jgi:hypothetical protein
MREETSEPYFFAMIMKTMMQNATDSKPINFTCP